MLIRRLLDKKTNHNEMINIGLHITTARKAKAQAKIQNYKHGRTRYTSKRGESFWLYNTNIFYLLNILRSVSLKLEI